MEGQKGATMKMILIVMALGVAAPPATQGGAFGLSMGQPITSVPGAKKYGSITYTTTDVPKPNPEFDSYMISATPQTGICKVTGLGKTHLNDSYGTDTRAAFDRLHAALEAKYGPGKDYNFLKSGSIWNEARDWFMSVQKKERTLASFWSVENGSALPETIDSLAIDVRAVSSGPYIAISYEFKNFEKCLAMKADTDNAGL